MRFVIAILALSTSLIIGCDSSGSPSSSLSTWTDPNALTEERVQNAVDRMLDEWQVGGSVRIRGIQENKEQSSAVADLIFDNFEIEKAGMEYVKKGKYQNSGNPIWESFNNHRVVKISGGGQARLSQYNDGRWVLKGVTMGRGFDAVTFTNDIELR